GGERNRHITSSCRLRRAVNCERFSFHPPSRLPYRRDSNQRGRGSLGALTAYFGGGVVVPPLLFFPFLPPLWPFLPPLCPFLPLEFVLAILDLISPPAGWATESAASVLTPEVPGATPGTAAVDPRSASSTYSTNAMFWLLVCVLR